MRALIITVFEVIGLLGLAIATGLYLARYDLALGVAVGSLVLILEAVVLAVLEPAPGAGDDA